MRLAASVLALAACLSIAACGEREAPADDAAAPAAEAPATPDTPAAPASNVALSLDGEGLRFIVADTGSTRLLEFGAPQDQTLTAVGNVLGQPTRQGDQQECGPGPLHYVEYGEQLTLWFQDGAFAGWQSESGPISTMNGVSADSSRADLVAAGVTEFNDTTLGQQFETNGLYGIMGESGNAAAILFVGANCFAP